MMETASLVSAVLNAQINSRVTVIPVEKNNRYHNTISLSVTGNEYIFIASVWEGYLGFTESFIEDIVLQGIEKSSALASFEESLETNYQVTMWFTPIRSTFNVNDSSAYYGTAFPFVIDFSL